MKKTVKMSKLSKKIFLSMLLLSTLFAVFTSFMQSALNYKLKKVALEAEIETILKNYTPPLERAMSNLDRDLVGTILDGLKTNSKIITLQIVNNSNDLVYSYNSEVSNHKQLPNSIFDENIILYSKDTKGNLVPVGHFYLRYTNLIAKQELISELTIIFAIQFAQAILIGLLFILILQPLLINRINAISEYLYNIKNQDDFLFTKLNTKYGQDDELDHLGAELNTYIFNTKNENLIVDPNSKSCPFDDKKNTISKAA